jgi:terminal uridylyltransferase
MRDEMNQQMAALYRAGGSPTHPPRQQPQHQQHQPQHHPSQQQPLGQSGESLMGLLNSTSLSPRFDLDNSRPRPPPVALSSSFPPAPMHMQHHSGAMTIENYQPQQHQHQPYPQQQQQHPQHRLTSPMTISGEDLLGLLHKGESRGSQHLSSSWDERDRYMSAPRPLMRTSSQVMARSPPHHRGDMYGGGGDGLARSLPPSRSPFGGGGGYDPLARRDSGTGMSFGNSSSNGGGMGGSTAVVSPDVTKPNDTIKVQVSLLTDECRPGRVLLIGLFRIGQPTNEKPIFVKQVLFENKIHRQARHWNTRITFRAPRSPGEFEFRIFEELKPRHRDQGDRDGEYNDNGGSGYYSNATIVRSNRLKVAMDYSHFIEFLRSITEKFRQNRVKRDTGGILSNLLAFMRLIDQIETVFLHGQALLEDFISDLLALVSLDEHEMARFPVTDTIPSPIETFHGTIRNVLNSVQANPWIKEFVSYECWQQVDFYQRRLYCAVSGLYFRSDAEKAAYWQYHYQFEPLSEVDTSSERWVKFVNEQVSAWIQKEAAKLIPNAEDFRRQRQGIYNVVHSQVVRKLDGLDAELDVFGSSANDFGTGESDMDMCLVLRPEIIATMNIDDKRRILSQAVHLLESRPDLFMEIDASRLTARIPIVMFKMVESGVECDLCVENVLAQRNTSLLRAYANADDRVRVLAYMLKQFVKRRRMNCAAESTLSSYGYLLMLIHYLQRQDPPVLPVLQTLPPSWNGESVCSCTAGNVSCPPKSSLCRLTERTEELVKERQLPSLLSRTPGASPGDVDGGSIAGTTQNGAMETYFFDPYSFPDSSEKLTLLQKFGSRNTSSVGELFIGFLQYYGLEFDASRSVVSVRMGRELLKSEKKTHHLWKLHSRLSIEDPFETSYDVAHVLKGTRDKYIRQQFVRAFTLLVQAADRGEGEVGLERVMRLVFEPVSELPFHTHKDMTTSAAMAAAAANAAGNAAAAATAASVLGGLFNDSFDASSFAD